MLSVLQVPHLYWEALVIWQRYGALVVNEARVGCVDLVGSVRHVDVLGVVGDVNVTGKILRLELARCFVQINTNYT